MPHPLFETVRQRRARIDNPGSRALFGRAKSAVSRTQTPAKELTLPQKSIARSGSEAHLRRTHVQVSRPRTPHACHSERRQPVQPVQPHPRAHPACHAERRQTAKPADDDNLAQPETPSPRPSQRSISTARVPIIEKPVRGLLEGCWTFTNFLLPMQPSRQRTRPSPHQHLPPRLALSTPGLGRTFSAYMPSVTPDRRLPSAVCRPPSAVSRPPQGVWRRMTECN